MKSAMRGGIGPGAGVVGSLLLVIGALAALNWRLLGMTIDISPVGVGGGTGALDGIIVAAGVAPFEAKPLSSYPETAARPLFSPTRRPRAVTARPTAEQPAPPRPAVDLHLVGVMMVAPAQKRALIRSPHQPRGNWIAEGEQIDGWTLSRITESAVVVESGGQRHELKLHPSGAARSADR